MGKYELIVENNIDMDESGFDSLGTYSTFDEAILGVQEMVDAFLEGTDHVGMTSDELYKYYTTYGDDPLIICHDPSTETLETASALNAAFNEVLQTTTKENFNTLSGTTLKLPTCETLFSAWEYARVRCNEMCKLEDTIASVLRYSVWPHELARFSRVLLACLGRGDIGVCDHWHLEAIRKILAEYPMTMSPSQTKAYSIILFQGSTSFSVTIYPDRFQLTAEYVPDRAAWEIHFYGSGRRDHRQGDISAAFEAMRQAALDPEYSFATTTG